MSINKSLKKGGLSHVPSAKSTFISIASHNQEEKSFNTLSKNNNQNPQKHWKTQKRDESTRKLKITQDNKQRQDNQNIKKRPLSLGHTKQVKSDINKIHSIKPSPIIKVKTNQLQQKLIQKKLQNCKVNLSSPLKKNKKDLGLTEQTYQIIKLNNIRKNNTIIQQSFLKLGRRPFQQHQAKNIIKKIN